MPTGSQMRCICSLSRHSPYTSKSTYRRLRASSSRLNADLSVHLRLILRNEPCRQAHKCDAFVRCRGIRRIHPNQHIVAYEQARRVSLLIWMCMAHCSRKEAGDTHRVRIPGLPDMSLSGLNHKVHSNRLSESRGWRSIARRLSSHG